MKLYEYQGKELLAKAGIPTPKGTVVSSLEELEARKTTLRYPIVVKAQVLVGGRGKAGGIQFAANWEEARAWAHKILGMRIQGLPVKKVLLVEKLEFSQELYASVMIDRESRESLFLVSASGGVDIESVPDAKIARKRVNPLSGVGAFATRELTQGLGLAPEVRKLVESILARLYRAFRDNDCELLEINPLAVTADGRVVAGDAKAIINDGALFRHPEFGIVEEDSTPLEQEARAQNIAFIQLPGRIGVIANGAGLTMATLDALNEFRGQAGVFLDLGGTDDPAQVTRAFRLMKKAKPSVVLLNLFGGITKCDTVAKGIKDVIDQEGIGFPIVSRVKGTNAKEADEILRAAGVHTATSLEDAAKKSIEVERGALSAAPRAKGGTA